MVNDFVLLDKFSPPISVLVSHVDSGIWQTVSFGSLCQRHCLSVKFDLNFPVRVSQVFLVADETAVFGAISLVVVCPIKVTLALDVAV